MNMHQDQPSGEQLPALPQNIDEICEGRDRAIQHWLSAFDQFHKTTDLAGLAMIGPAIRLENRTDCRGYDGDIVRLSKAFSDGNDREEFEKYLTREVDRRCWNALCDQLGFETLMDAQARSEFHDGLREEPPIFKAENCVATFGDLWLNQRDYYLRGIANVFSDLDRRFRSHDGFKIGARIILERSLGDWHQWADYNKKHKLHDVERIFYELDDEEQRCLSDQDERRINEALRTGGSIPDSDELPITRAIEVAARRYGLPHVIHGRYFRVRIFKNGNLHIWFERKDLLAQVNKLLAEYYGEVIGDAYDTTHADDAPAYHVTPAKGWGAFNSSSEVAEKVMQYAGIHEGARVLEPSAGTGMLAEAARERGGQVSCYEIQAGLAYEHRRKHGFDCIEGDFLKQQPPAKLYDRIIMNPPFDRGRDCDHVQHAMKFLKPGGRLVAVMSARAEFADNKRHKAFHKMVEQCEPAYGRLKWHDLPAGSFAHAGTNVNTVILAITKPS